MKTLGRFIAGALVAFLFVSLAPVPPALAATINVGCDVNDLIAAINAANVGPDAETLELAVDCTYSFTQPSSIDYPVGNTALPIITSEIIIHGNGATIERGVAGGAPDMRLLRLSSAAVLTLDQLTLLNGHAGFPEPFIPNYEYSGGAILNYGGQLTILNSTFRNNTVYILGGAIYTKRGALTISDSLFEQNHSGLNSAGINNDGGQLEIGTSIFRENEGHYGTAIHNRGGNAKIRQSIFEGNIARESADIWGFPAPNPFGIIVNSSHGTLVIEDSIVRNNKSDHVGGLVTFDDQTTILRSTFSGNEAELGGAVWNWDQGQATIIDSVFTSNIASKGGAIHNTGTLSIGSSTFEGNNGFRGGAIWSNNSLTLANSTFHRNSADFGGGIFNHGLLKLRNDTFVRNTAVKEGGNLWSDGNVVAGNTIFTRGKPQNCFGTIEPKGGNLRFSAGDPSGVGEYGDPKLGPLQDNGGVTHTMALEAGSAAIDHGKKSVCLAPSVNNVDQRGVTRLTGGANKCDAGAYEVD